LTGIPSNPLPPGGGGLAPINLPTWYKIAAWKKKAIIIIRNIERKIPLQIHFDFLFIVLE
jgi:hypothetical protein